MSGIYLMIKALITGAVVVGVSELAKKNPLTGAWVASLPLTSIAAFLWIYHDTQNAESIQSLSMGIFWMVIPSLAFFLILPALIKYGIHFYASLAISCGLTFAVYALFMWVIGMAGIKI